jgi:hypothetical protein
MFFRSRKWQLASIVVQTEPLPVICLRRMCVPRLVRISTFCKDMWNTPNTPCSDHINSYTNLHSRDSNTISVVFFLPKCKAVHNSNATLRSNKTNHSDILKYITQLRRASCLIKPKYLLILILYQLQVCHPRISRRLYICSLYIHLHSTAVFNLFTRDLCLVLYLICIALNGPVYHTETYFCSWI